MEQDLEVVAADRTQWRDVLALLSCGEGWMVEHYEAAQAAAGLNFRGDDRGEELRRGRGAWSCACASLVATPGHPVRDGLKGVGEIEIQELQSLDEDDNTFE